MIAAFMGVWDTCSSGVEVGGGGGGGGLVHSSIERAYLKLYILLP